MLKIIVSLLMCLALPMITLAATDESTKVPTPAERAADFAKRLTFKDEIYYGKSRLAAMQDVAKEGNLFVRKKNYSQAIFRYYDALLFMPSTLLFFKLGDVGIINRMDAMKTIDFADGIQGSLDEYDTGITFYQYEKFKEKSVSQDCLKKMKQKVECLRAQEVLFQARHEADYKASLRIEDLEQCMKLGPDTTQQATYCQ